MFYKEEECKKYEKSTLFAVRKQLKKLNNRYLSVYDLCNEGNYDCEVEIFDVQTDKDLENLRRYLYLKAINNGASEENIQECFSSDKYKEQIFDGVTKGYEVIIWWNCYYDNFWVYRDGSIDGYLLYKR